MGKESITIGRPIEKIDIREFKKAWDDLNVGPREGGFLLINTPELYEALLNELDRRGLFIH